MGLLIGKVLHARYQIKSLLGDQTGRKTFLANDLQTGLSVIVKLLLFDRDFDWDDLKLLEREAGVLKSLDHPAIPRYLDYFDAETEIGKGFALVQTYIAARSLQDWIQSGRTFSEEELEAIAEELLRILDYLHNRQPSVIHRDIKPSNILLVDRSEYNPLRIHLIDFGSVQTAVQTGKKTIVGTYGYMPPEQFGGEATPASDLYALGATLIYLATGCHPDQLPQQEMRILFEDRVHLSPNFVDFLRWSTEPNLELRFRSTRQALGILERSHLPGSLPNPALPSTTLQGSNLREYPSTLAPKPAGSRVQLTKTGQMLEVLILPRGFHPGLIPLIGFAIVWNSFLIMWSGIIFRALSFGSWFLALFPIIHVGVGLWLIWEILFTLLESVRLRITPSEIALSKEINGFNCLPILVAPRQDISKIELTSLSYRKGSKGRQIAVPPQINIWAGVKKFVVASENSLTSIELDWLAQEFCRWLNIPIS